MINEPAAWCNCEKYTRFPCFKESTLKALKYLYALISGRYAAATARARDTAMLSGVGPRRDGEAHESRIYFFGAGRCDLPICLERGAGSTGPLPLKLPPGS
jgi:hypothetical protein